MQFRLGKKSDAKEIARLHYTTRSGHERGFFPQMRQSFLIQYYRIILDNPYSVVIVCEDDNQKLVGFCSASLKYESEIKSLKKHILQLGIAALPSFLMKPKMILETFKRLISVKKDVGYIVNQGPRGEYWVWDSQCKESLHSIIMNEKHLQILNVLGIKNLSFEVDVLNKNVYNFAKRNGAIFDQRITLEDGRERVIMHYDLTKPRRFSFN